MIRTWLVVLLAVLMVAPTEVRAASQLSLGLGYVRSACEIANEAGSLDCFSGLRTEVLFSFFHKDDDDASPAKGKITDEDSSNSSWANHLNFGNWGGGDGRVILATLVIILLLFGIYWTIVAIGSRRLKLGLFWSHDFQQNRWSDKHDFSRYNVDRLGLQAGFYLFPRFDLQLHVGAGPAYAQVETVAGDERELYHIDGISTKAGLGYVPMESSGPFFLYEVEGTFFSRTSLAKYVEKNTTRLPSLRRTGTVMAGWTFAF